MGEVDGLTQGLGSYKNINKTVGMKVASPIVLAQFFDSS